MISAESTTQLADTETLTRGQWQAHIGSRLYGDYYRLATEQTPPVSIYSQERYGPEQALIKLGRKSATRIVESAAGTPAEALFADRKEELFRYTDFDAFWVGGASRVETSVRAQMEDGLMFAHKMTMGVVVETIRSAGLKVNYRDAYRSAGAVLNNPQFDSVLAPSALTGFAVIGSSNAPQEDYDISCGLGRVISAVSPFVNENISIAIELDGPVEDIDDLQSIGMSLNPSWTKALRLALANQNRQIKDGTHLGPADIRRRSLSQSGFSSGCPVAHNPDIFPRMRRYLAETARLTEQSL